MFRQAWRRYATYNRFKNSPPPINVNFVVSLLSTRRAAYVGGGLAAFYVYNLDRAPYSGRLRCLWVPDQAVKLIGDLEENNMLQSFKGSILPKSNPLQYRISKIMNRLLASALESLPTPERRRYLELLPWEIHIINDNLLPPNAFVLPNGKIYVTSSILPIAENDSGIATVLGHELAHLLALHSSEALLKKPVQILVSSLLYLATGSSLVSNLFTGVLLSQPASRAQETEADRIGCELMAMLCFNLNELTKFWKRMSDYERAHGSVDNALTNMLSTHPASKKRVEDIQLWMPHLREVEEKSGCNQHLFERFNKVQYNFFK